MAISNTKKIQPGCCYDEQGWLAELQLGFENQSEKTVIAQRKQRGPLGIQRPFYPEDDVCHAYVLHPPGGVVGGDQLILNLRAAKNSNALLTTPGATKYYRSGGAQARQQQRFSVEGGSLEWLPQENIFFPGAHCSLTTDIQLDDSAQYIGWEIQCLGRPAIGETFEFGQLEFKTTIHRNDKPLFIERFKVQGADDLQGMAGLRGMPVFATMIAIPDYEAASSDALMDDLKETVRAKCIDSNTHAGATILNGVMIVRYLGNSTAEAHHLFRAIWEKARPLINQRKPEVPRIWAT